MKKADETISLLPFIESKGDAFLLDIPAFDQIRESFQGYSYPFQLADKEQNFSIIVKGGLKVKNSEPFKSLFLLVQRDHYPIHPDGLSPFTNAAIDRIWHETILFYASDKDVFIVPNQLGLNGTATPFRSLFFCKKIKSFFHPPCPECGGALTLCKDDELLIKETLSPYSTSLKRYLFCPDCYASKGNLVFYQFSRSSEDRILTKDRFDLVRDFNRLKNTVPGNFPCPDCPGHAECYITGEKASSNIGFFSFYPFHMIFFDADPIKAIEFIPLLSGASVKDMERLSPTNSLSHLEENLTHPGGTDFFFKNDEKFYLEVLFLKLSFFEEITRFLYQRVEKNIHPLMTLSTQSIWIRPKSKGSILPFFWDFKLTIIDLISNSSKNHIESTLTRDRSLEWMASLWFYLFLVNHRQDQAVVYDTLSQLVKKGLGDSLLSDYNTLIKAFPNIAMENIFWNPDERSVPHKWNGFWLKTIEIGLSLFDPEKGQDLKLYLNQLAGKIAPLKQAVKEDLFSKGREDVMPGPLKASHRTVTGQSPSQLEKIAVSTILKKLKTQWESKSAVSSNDDDVLETVVLSSPDKKPDMDFNDATDVKTMIISPASEKEPSKKSGFDDMEKTIILTPKGNMQKDIDFFSKTDDLDKTVIITPKKLK